MGRRGLILSVGILLLFISMEVNTILAQGNGNGNNNGNGNGTNNGNNNGNNNGSSGNGNNNGNGDGQNNGNDNGNGGNNGTSNGGGNGNGNGNGNGTNNGNGNGNGNDSNGKKQKKPPPYDAASTNYEILSPLPSGQEQVLCRARGKCQNQTLTCPDQCAEKKPKKNKKNKGCFIDCSSKCETSCKWRRPKCNGYGALCYDPRFVGGDGVMFYFHGEKGSDFAIVSDQNLHINGHLIGTRPQGRTRDYTWVQALSIMFDSHTLVLAAKKVKHWTNDIDALIVKWDGESINIDTNSEWRTKSGDSHRGVVIERTDDVNTVKVTVQGLVEMDLRVAPIGEKENLIHNYQLPSDDAFAHLETQFKFVDLSDDVEGILGKTYRPGYVSPVKRGVPMPMMGGEDKYKTPSLYSPACKVCRFQRPSGVATA